MEGLVPLVPFLIFLHVLAAIVAFGPTFAFSFVGAMGQKEPQHANFGIRLSHTISSRLVYPIGITLPITGLTIMAILQINPLEPSHWWLGIAIVLYVVAYGYSFFVQRKLVERAIELSSTPPPPGEGPPPELPALGKRIGQGGMVMGLLLVIIIFLMVVKPQF
jgi:hypothetical protein